MGEAKQRAEAAAKAAAEFNKMINTPMTQDEANDAIARIDMQKAQLGVIRIQLMNQLNNIDLQLAQAEYDRSIVIRRALLKPKADGAGNGGEDGASGSPDTPEAT